MKPHTLPVKRRPAPKGLFRRLSAVTTNRKQRVAAAAASSDMDLEDGSSKISRALTIIFLIHIVAIGLIFFHQKFLDGRPGDEAKMVHKATPAATRPNLPPKVSAGDETYSIQQGDNYQTIAAKLNVEESELRRINDRADISPGVRLLVPPKHIVAQEPPSVTELRKQSTPRPDDGLVAASDQSGVPRAVVVTPKVSHETAVKPEKVAKVQKVEKELPKAKVAAAPASSGKSYTVQKGDSIWRIANRNKVDEKALMKANGITDARKIKPGMKLNIP